MSGIKRISWNGEHGMEELPDGDYVLHSDHEAEVARLRAEVEKVRGYEVAPLEAKVAELRTEIEENENVINVWRGRTQRAEAEAEGLRNDALEIAQALAWQCRGMSFGFSDVLLSTHDALILAERIKAAIGEGK